jgi:hypothetical protein
MIALMQFLSRAGLTMTNPFHPQRSYHRPRRGDSCSDFLNVAGDMKKVTKALGEVTRKELASNGRK